MQLLTWLHVSDYRTFFFEHWKTIVLKFNSLVSNHCFSHRNIFQNGVNTLSMVNQFRPYHFVQISPSCGHKYTYQITYGATSDFQCVTPRMRDCRNYVISASVCRNCVISRIFGSRHLAKITVFRQSPSCRNHGITAKNSQISAFSWCYWYLVRFMSLVAYRRTALNPLLKHY